MKFGPAAGALAALVLGTAMAAAAAPVHAPGWTAAWASPPFPVLTKDIPKHTRFFDNQTVRQVVRVDAAGERIRLRLTNELGATALPVGAVHIALSDVNGVLRPGSDRVVTFGGRAAVTIPPGAPLVSDPIDLPVKRFDQLAISVYYPKRVEPSAHHLDVFISQPGNYAGAPQLPGATESYAPGLASQVQVLGRKPPHLIVAFGDSITEGAASTPKAYKSWPDQFADMLAADPKRRDWVVINSGISGNRILHDGAGANGLARFDRDALDIPGVTDIILLEGINDIGWGHRPGEIATAQDLIAADKQMIARAHARGIRIYAGVLTPFQGAVYYSAEGEADRETLNRWIRTSGAFDGVIDFEKPMEDPANPLRLNDADQHGDNLHPNDAGYAIMAKTVDRELLPRLGR